MNARNTSEPEFLGDTAVLTVLYKWRWDVAAILMTDVADIQAKTAN